MRAARGGSEHGEVSIEEEEGRSLAMRAARTS